MLEPGECFLRDYSATHHIQQQHQQQQHQQQQHQQQHHQDNQDNHEQHNNKKHQQQIKGRIKLCSRSLVFEPQSYQWPILRFVFKEAINSIQQVQQTESQIINKSHHNHNTTNTFTIGTEVVIKMKEEGKIGIA